MAGQKREWEREQKKEQTKEQKRKQKKEQESSKSVVREVALTALDVHYLVKELKGLCNGKLDRIFEGEGDRKGEFLFQFHVSGEGKKLLYVLLPGICCLVSEKPSFPQRPPGFCVFLRKHLQGGFIREVRQVGFERIIEFEIEKRNKGAVEKSYLILELFSNGNVVFCDEEYVIRGILERQRWADRVLREKLKYEFPPRTEDVREISFEDFRNRFYEFSAKGEQGNIVAFLAKAFGFGGKYAEEIFARAGCTRKKGLDEEDLKKIYEEARNIFELEPKPAVSNGIPYPFLPGNAEKTISFNSFSEAVESLLDFEKLKKEELTVDKKNKTETVLREQENQRKGFLKAAEENQRKGEFIYENYSLLKELLDRLRKLSGKSFDEVEDFLKEEGARYNIKKYVLDRKNKAVTIELPDK